MIYQRQSKRRGVAYQVKRLEGKLNATFYNAEAALLQDALWKRWGRSFPIVLADTKPSLPQALLEAVLTGSASELSPIVLAQFLAAHPSRDAAVVVDNRELLLGEYVATFFELWEYGRVPGSTGRRRSDKAARAMEEALNRLVLEVLYECDERGHRIRNEEGLFYVHPDRWAAGAIARMPISKVRSKDILALDQKVKEKGVGLEVWRKVLGFLQQLFDLAVIEELIAANPVRSIKKPPQSRPRARSAMMPDKLELIRSDFLHLDELARTRKRGEVVAGSPARVPVPELPGYALHSADFVETLGYSACRPGELFAVTVDDLIEGGEGRVRLTICRRCVDGTIVDGTKSQNFPTRSVYLLGPASETLKRRAEIARATSSRLLFPFPGSEQPWTESQYRRWRSRFYQPIARANGLDEHSDDPYSLRHTYASLRVAAGHPVPHIEQSMGTGLVREVYTTVFHEWEGKKPLDIDRAIREARRVALANRDLNAACLGVAA